MSDHDRGAYTPQSDSPLAFDARRTRAPAQRSGNGALIFSGVVLLIVLTALAVFAYTRFGGAGPVEEAETYEAIKTGDEVEQAETFDPAETGMVVQPVESLPPANIDPGPVPIPSVTAPVAEKPKPAPKPVVVAEKPAPVPAKPAVPPKPEPVKTAPAPTAPRTVSNAQVQIGAFSSAGLAEREWNDLALAIPVEMAGKTRRIEPVEGGDGVRYRSMVGGFASREAAQAFCDRLVSRGRDCLVR